MTRKALVFYAEDRPGVGRIVSVFKGDQASAEAHVDRRGLPSLMLEDGDPTDARTLLEGYCVDLTGPAPVLAGCQPPPATWNPEASTFTGLPPGSTVRILGVAHAVDDGEADLSDLPPGDYAVTISAAGYLTQTYQVTR